MSIKMKYEHLLSIYACLVISEKCLAISLPGVNHFIAVFVFGGLVLFTRRRNELNLSLIFSYLAFALWIVASVLWSRYIMLEQLLHMGIIVLPVLLSMIIVMMGINNKELSNINKSALYTGIVVVLYLSMLGEGGMDGNTVRWRLSLDSNNGYSDPNFLSMLLIYPILIALIKIKNNRMGYFYFIAAMLMLYGIILMGSRGTIFAIIITMIIKFYFEKKYKTIFLMCALLLSLGYYMYDLIYETIGNRYDLQFMLETGGAGRMDIWSVGYEIIKDNFICGVGVFNSSFVYNHYVSLAGIGGSRDYVRLMHNLYIEIMAELGLIGMLLYLNLIYRTLRGKAGFLINKCPEVIYSIIAVSISSMFLHTLSEKILWFLLGVAGAYRDNNVKPEES